MVSAVLLDVNETLLDLSGLQAAFTDIGVSPKDLPLWFARTQREGFGLAASGDWRTFRDIGIAMLAQMAPDASYRQRAEVLDAMGACSLHLDVPAGFNLLQERGFTVATLTVGDSAVVASVFAAAGIEGVLHLSCDAVQCWKPAQRAYHYAIDSLQTPKATMISAHQWDLHGAARAGLHTAWLNRTGSESVDLYAKPDVEAAGLVTLVGMLPSPQ